MPCLPCVSVTNPAVTPLWQLVLLRGQREPRGCCDGQESLLSLPRARLQLLCCPGRMRGHGRAPCSGSSSPTTRMRRRRRSSSWAGSRGWPSEAATIKLLWGVFLCPLRSLCPLSRSGDTSGIVGASHPQAGQGLSREPGWDCPCLLLFHLLALCC